MVPIISNDELQRIQKALCVFVRVWEIVGKNLMISFKHDRNNEIDEVRAIIQKIRRGDSKCRERFIDENKTLIMRAVGSALNRSNVVRNSSEFLLGVEVFNYCLNNFDLESKISFYEYTEKSIIMRINEYNMRGSEDKLTEIEEDSEKISQFKKELWRFGLTTKDIIMATPKQQDDLRRAVLLARKITESNELYNRLQNDKNIPISGVNADLHDKNVLKRNAKYIIAVCLIMKSNMETIKGYLKSVEMNWSLDNHRGIVLELTGKGSVIINDEGKFLFIMKQYNIELGNEVNYENYLVKIDNKIIEQRYFKVLMGVTALLIVAMISTSLIYRMIDDDSLNNTDLLVNKNNIVLEKVDNIDKGKKDVQNNTEDNEKTIENQQKKIPGANKDNNKDNKESRNGNKVKNKEVDMGVSAKLNANSINLAEYEKNKTNLKAHNNDENQDKTEKTMDVKASQKNQKVDNNKSTPAKGDVHTKKHTTPVSEESTSTKELRTEGSDGSTNYFPTLRATGLPGNIQITSDKNVVKVGEEYVIEINIRHGNNGTSWTLYENGIQTATIHMADRSPEAQRVQRLFIAHKEGVYTYRCDVNNTFGTVSSEQIQVVVEN